MLFLLLDVFWRLLVGLCTGFRHNWLPGQRILPVHGPWRQSQLKRKKKQNKASVVLFICHRKCQISRESRLWPYRFKQKTCAENMGYLKIKCLTKQDTAKPPKTMYTVHPNCSTIRPYTNPITCKERTRCKWNTLQTKSKIDFIKMFVQMSYR